jgi:hypothetical protein
MIEVTVTVKQMDHTGETTLTKIGTYTPCNPIFYADQVRHITSRLAEDFAGRFETLYPTATDKARQAVEGQREADARKLRQ